MYCPKCGTVMKRTMRFEPEKQSEFYRCGKCWFESKPKRLIIKPDKDEENQKSTKQNTRKRPNKNAKNNQTRRKKKKK